MDNETLKTILKLQEENTLYSRAISEACYIVNEVVDDVPLTGNEEIDFFLTLLCRKFKELSVKEEKNLSGNAD